MEGAGALVTEHLSQPYFPAIGIDEAQSLHPDDSNDQAVGGMISGNGSLWGGARARAAAPRTHAHATEVPVLPLKGAFVNS